VVTDDLVRMFAWTFRGNTDHHGTWEGGCNRIHTSLSDYRNHLIDGPHIGIYPMVDNNVGWGCIDIDTDNLPLARNLQAALRYKDVSAHVERTRRGWHVWVFAEPTWVTAQTMRRALMAACKAIGYDPKEVNPKAETLEPGKIGNYVRLPYPSALIDTPNERFFIDDNDEPISVYDLEKLTPTPLEQLETIAQLWQPRRSTVTVDGGSGSSVETLLPLLPRLAFTIWRDGPLPGSDRSSTLARLAYLLADDGFTPQAAFTIVASADARWGKYSTRADRDERIGSIIERAYAR
jgi:hypothetical protein